LRAVIFANGAHSYPQIDRSHLRPDDWLIAANGGARYCLALGLKPAVLIGDFDSLEPWERQEIEQTGTSLVVHPARKDETDLELALRYAIEGGADEILILGGLGDRWDQSLANLLLPAAPKFAGASIRLVDGPQEVILLRGGESLTLHGQPGDRVSLIPVKGDAHGVTTRGLEYPLNGDTLQFGVTRGVSNVLLSDQATLHLEHGLLACFVIHNLRSDDS
jgi:thiamine pyrophosphokinase